MVGMKNTKACMQWGEKANVIMGKTNSCLILMKGACVEKEQTFKHSS